MSRVGFFVPPDVDDAHERWGANCGPAAIAAAFGLSLAAVEAAVAKRGSYPGHMGIPDLRRACKALGRGCSRGQTSPGPISAWPESGTHIGMINIDGPWRRHPRSQAKHRHIVAVRFDAKEGIWRVYDINPGGWLGARTWIDIVMNSLAAAHDPASTGMWDFRWRGTLAAQDLAPAGSGS